MFFFLFIYFFLFAIFILHSRESELYRYVFGRYVRTRLGVAIYEVSEPPVFHMKMGRPVKCLAQLQQANLPACSPQPPINAERQAGKL